jgi:hypothetical protein
MPSTQAPPVEPEGGAAASILANGLARSRSAPVRRGTWPGSVARFRSVASVRRTGSTPHKE